MIVELPDEHVAFLKELAHELKTQNNRATAAPYFFVVQGKRETAAPRGHGDDRYYVREWAESFDLDGLREALKERFHEDLGFDPEEAKATFDVYVDRFIQNDCDVYGQASVIVEDNAFLTFKGFKEHMELNGHNYRHLSEVQSYLKHAFRNPELDKLWKAILAFADIPADTVSEETV